MNMKRIITLLFLSLCVYVAKAQYSGSGSGTAESPYLITTALNVEEIRNFQGVAGVQFRLMNDIDMTELIEDTYGDAGWNPIPDFQGVLDGNGYTISGLFINRPTVERVGFFRDLSNAQVHDLLLVFSGDIIGYSGNTTGNYYVGGLSAICSASKIERCYVKGNLFFGIGSVGGLCGYTTCNYDNSVSSYISECVVEVLKIEGGISGETQCGGLIGYGSRSIITNNRVNSYIANNSNEGGNDNDCLGGIVGYPYFSQINNNLFEGKLYATNNNRSLRVGGIVGFISSKTPVYSNVAICDSIILNENICEYGRITSNDNANLSDITATNANKAYNKTVIVRGQNILNATDSRANGLSVGQILLKNTNMYKSMGWDMDNVWFVDEGNTYPRLKWEVEKGLSKPILTIKYNETVIVENDVIPFLAEKATTDLGGGVSYTYYQCIPDEPIIVNTSNRTQQITVTITSQDYSHLKWAGIDGQNADMKESSESRTCQLERGASVPLKLHAVFADQDFGSYSATVNVSCEDYSRTFQITFTNENPNKPVCPTPDIDYSEGKLVFSCNVEGTPEYHVTISDPDVTTHVVGHELDIERTYTVEVFATAEGYQASETTKLILCWIDAKISDSVEGIISEKGLPLKIRMGNGLVTISGVENNTLVSAYTLDGVLLDSTTSTSETVTLTIPSSTEVIVLKVGDNSVKIVF